MKVEPYIILKLFLNIEDVTTSEDQRVIFKSFFIDVLFHQ